jgi:hypothetical protein
MNAPQKPYPNWLAISFSQELPNSSTVWRITGSQPLYDEELHLLLWTASWATRKKYTNKLYI